MRLVNVETFRLEEFIDCNQVAYAILSHRWEDEEILYKDIIRAGGRLESMSSWKGFYKVRKSCETAAKLGYTYVWIDTCCIDKSSSAELQEAINSMFRWYAEASVCFAFLSDVQWPKDENAFGRSQWFSRGWTLQELLAPSQLTFFDGSWRLIASRRKMAAEISQVTGIPRQILRSAFDPQEEPRPCIANIMSWARGRETTRPEDRAYSLIGLFDVNMPLLYGEGEKAFYRLQCEILRQTEDQSIFAWQPYESRGSQGLLATSPDSFQSNAASELLRKPYILERRAAHSVTNEGIELEVRLLSVLPRIYIAFLNVLCEQDDDEQRLSRSAAGIYLRRIDDGNRYARIPKRFLKGESDLVTRVQEDEVSRLRKITVVRRIKDDEGMENTVNNDCGFSLASSPLFGANTWSHWLRNRQVAVFGSRQGSELRLTNNDKPSTGLTACVQNKHSPPFASGEFPLHNIGLGFDFDFGPILLVCVSSGSLGLTEYHLSRDLGLRSTSAFENRHLTENSTFSVQRCHGGIYRVMGDDTVAFKVNILEPGYSRTLVAVLALSSTGNYVYLALLRSKTEEHQWKVFIEIDHKDFGGFMKRFGQVCETEYGSALKVHAHWLR